MRPKRSNLNQSQRKIPAFRPWWTILLRTCTRPSRRLPTTCRRPAPAVAPAREAERAPRGVKLAKISRTGDRVFRSLATTSGLAIVLLVLFVGFFLLALALPSLRANQDNFLISRNWTVAGNELRFGIAGLFWTTVLSSILAMAMAVPVAIGVALCLTQYLHKRSRRPSFFRGRSAGRRTVDHLRPLGPDHFGPLSGPRSRVADRQTRLDPAVQQECGPQGLSLCGLRGAGHYDLADSDSDLSRRFRADPARSHRGSACSWRNPLGGHSHRSASTRKVGRRQRVHARPRACARGDHRCHDHPHHPAPRRPVHPVDLRRRRDVRQQDREQCRRVRQPIQDWGLHRCRAGALRRHLRGQRDCPDHRRARGRSHDGDVHRHPAGTDAARAVSARSRTPWPLYLWLSRLCSRSFRSPGCSRL